MQKTGKQQCTPRLADPSVTPRPWVDFSSGYFQRAADKFPKQGSRQPWRLNQNYLADLLLLRFGRLDDGVMEFSGATRTAAVTASGPEIPFNPSGRPKEAISASPHRTRDG
jgi:hypothetical protein